MIEAIRQNIAGYGISRQISAEYTCEFEAIPTDATYDLILSLDSWYLIGRNRENLQKALARSSQCLSPRPYPATSPSTS